MSTEQMHFRGLISALTFGLAAADTLVLHDGLLDLENDFTLFFSDFKKQFLQDLVFKNIKDEKRLALVSGVDLSKNLYDNVVIFPITGRGLGKTLTPADLLQYTGNDHGNVFVIGNEKSGSDEIRLFLNQLGIYPAPKQYQIHDHFHSVEGNHTLLLIPVEKHLVDDVIVGETLKTDDVLYSGSLAILSNNELLLPVLVAPRTAYTYNPKKKEKSGSTDEHLTEGNSWGIGSQEYLAVGFQNLANLRVAWVGSSDFLSDAFYERSNYKNERIALDLLTWTFGGKNALRIDYIEFYKTDKNTFNSKLLKDTFKVKDEVVYNIAISEFKNGEWVPYHADDVQLEFKMLDPYYRLTLEQVSQNHPSLSFNVAGLSEVTPNNTFYKNDLTGEKETSQFYLAKFVLPDQHGMFKYLVEYKKPGFSFLTSENIITLRNLAFDEYTKSTHIVNSWVYLSAIATLVSGWLVFLVLFLFNGSSAKATVTKKNK